MNKVIVIPDSFKGTLSSETICEVIEKKVVEYYPDCEVVKIPVADGGEGSVDCFLSALGGQKKVVKATDPFFEEMDSFYGLIDNGRTAVIEMASCAGLPLVKDHKDPSKTTTYGVGELVNEAIYSGVEKIILGLGGSATNDGGCGAAAAVGVKFYDKEGSAFVPVGGTLKEIAHIDISERDRRLEEVEIVTMCDIDNPMYGETGAAYIFGPQKGADAQMVLSLDAGLKHLSAIIKRDLGLDLSRVPGAGAAGAMGAGMIAFFSSNLQMGIETVLDTVGFEEKLAGCDMVFTGEGKLDTQSLRGKVVVGVARRTRPHNIPVTVIVGGADKEIDEVYDLGVSSVFTINRMPQELSVSAPDSKDNLAFAVDNLMRYTKLIQR